MVGVGFELAAALLVGVFGGQWFDRRFGTAPWALFAGTLLGAGSGLFSIYRRIGPPGGPEAGGRR
jgi:F0F1-type ATP synthase assembly protein I